MLSCCLRHVAAHRSHYPSLLLRELYSPSSFPFLRLLWTFQICCSIFATVLFLLVFPCWTLPFVFHLFVAGQCLMAPRTLLLKLTRRCFYPAHQLELFCLLHLYCHFYPFLLFLPCHLEQHKHFCIFL